LALKLALFKLLVLAGSSIYNLSYSSTHLSINKFASRLFASVSIVYSNFLIPVSPLNFVLQLFSFLRGLDTAFEIHFAFLFYLNLLFPPLYSFALIEILLFGLTGFVSYSFGRLIYPLNFF
jgi:hypothetical protein